MPVPASCLEKPFIKSPLIRIGGGTLLEMHVQVSPGPTGRRPGAMPICCSGPVTWRFYSAPCTRSGHRGPSRAVPVCTLSVDSEKETQRLGNRALGRQDSFTVTPVGSSAQALLAGGGSGCYFSGSAIVRFGQLYRIISLTLLSGVYVTLIYNFCAEFR